MWNPHLIRSQQLSILVHPDKNQDDADRAQQAFEGIHTFHHFGNGQCFTSNFLVINRAYKILENEKTRKRCLEIVDEAKGILENTVIPLTYVGWMFRGHHYCCNETDLQIAEKRKKLKKEGKETRIDEDDPQKYKRAIYVMTMKLFADMEKRRRELDQRDMEERGVSQGP